MPRTQEKNPYITIHDDVGILCFKDYFVESIFLSMCTGDFHFLLDCATKHGLCSH